MGVRWAGFLCFGALAANCGSSKCDASGQFCTGDGDIYDICAIWNRVPIVGSSPPDAGLIFDACLIILSSNCADSKDPSFLAGYRTCLTADGPSGGCSCLDGNEASIDCDRAFQEQLQLSMPEVSPCSH